MKHTNTSKGNRWRGLGSSANQRFWRPEACPSHEPSGRCPSQTCGCQTGADETCTRLCSGEAEPSRCRGLWNTRLWRSLWGGPEAKPTRCWCLYWGWLRCSLRGRPKAESSRRWCWGCNGLRCSLWGRPKAEPSCCGCWGGIWLGCSLWGRAKAESRRCRCLYRPGLSCSLWGASKAEPTSCWRLGYARLCRLGDGAQTKPTEGGSGSCRAKTKTSDRRSPTCKNSLKISQHFTCNLNNGRCIWNVEMWNTFRYQCIAAISIAKRH